MPSLAELQRAFRAELLGGDPPGAPPWDQLVVAAGLSAGQRLAVHRNNALSSLAEALQETFPVVCRLVGESFFTAAARAFIRREPPGEPRLSQYGAGFAAFLAAFPPARPLAYLPDVARLEWAVNEAFHAPQAPPLDPARLDGVAPEAAAAIRLALHPSCRLVSSPYPIERIWRANQPEADASETIDLGLGGCRLLVHRQGLDIRLVQLSPGEAALLAAVAAEAMLAEAYERAMTAESSFDLATALQRHFAGGVFAERA